MCYNFFKIHTSPLDDSKNIYKYRRDVGIYSRDVIHNIYFVERGIENILVGKIGTFELQFLYQNFRLCPCRFFQFQILLLLLLLILLLLDIIIITIQCVPEQHQET